MDKIELVCVPLGKYCEPMNKDLVTETYVVTIQSQLTAPFSPRRELCQQEALWVNIAL